MRNLPIKEHRTIGIKYYDGIDLVHTYEADESDVINALVEFVYEDYFYKCEKTDELLNSIRCFISFEDDIDGVLLENYADELRDYFQEEATQYYRDCVDEGKADKYYSYDD